MEIGGWIENELSLICTIFPMQTIKFMKDLLDGGQT